MLFKLSDTWMRSGTLEIDVVECSANSIHLHIYIVNIYT